MNWREEFLHCVFWVSPSCSKMPAANFFLSPTNPLKPCVRSNGPDSLLWIPLCNVAAGFCNFFMISQNFLQTFLLVCWLCMHLQMYIGSYLNYLQLNLVLGKQKHTFRANKCYLLLFISSGSKTNITELHIGTCKEEDGSDSKHFKFLFLEVVNNYFSVSMTNAGLCSCHTILVYNPCLYGSNASPMP